MDDNRDNETESEKEPEEGSEYEFGFTRGSDAPVEEQPEDGFSGDGSYRFVRPQHGLYEDAEYAPCSEEPDIPSYYVPTEKKPKKERKSYSLPMRRLICVCLCCTLLGGLFGGFIAAKIADRSINLSLPMDKPISGNQNGPNITQTASGSGSTIYELGCSQTVGVTTEVTTTNWFGQTSSSAVSGSGFIVTDNGYIITNYHVIEYAAQYNYKVSVMTFDGTSYDAVIVGFEESNDIAVLKIDANGLNPITVGDSDAIAVGDEVFAIGNPLGELAFSMTTGHISALDRSISTQNNKPAINMFQFDAAVNSGNSGGPLYNANGEVIGVVTAKYSSSGVEGLGFAIPINDAVDIANDLITTGYVTGRAYLGVNIDNRYTSVYADYYNMPEGAYIYSVEKGSCAEKAGFNAGDIITKVDDKAITSYQELSAVIHKYKAGDKASIVVYRSNGYLTLNVVFDESKPANGAQGNMERSGFSSYSPQTA